MYFVWWRKKLKEEGKTQIGIPWKRKIVKNVYRNVSDGNKGIFLFVLKSFKKVAAFAEFKGPSGGIWMTLEAFIFA